MNKTQNDFLKTYTFASDGTVTHASGKTVLFSFQKFKEQICQKRHCFVCGARPNKTFNDEHVIPRWLQRLCNLQNKELTIPNKEKVKYGTYKISCCKECNSKLGEIYEKPISDIISGGYEKVVESLKSDKKELICSWLSLIFLKTHLRDFTNNISLDLRENLGSIGSDYDLNDLHHTHALARAATAGVKIDPSVFGSLIVIQIEPTEENDTFDYCDNLLGHGILIKIRDTAMSYILNDCGATSSMLSKKFAEIPNPISEVQLREIYAHYLTANVHIKHRPTFGTKISFDGNPHIFTSLPELEFYDYKPAVFGRFFSSAIGCYVDHIQMAGKTRKETIELLKAGELTFLLDEEKT